MDLSNRCIFCKSSSNLNTKMTMIVDSVEYHVAICSEHEEEASPKTIKAAITTNINEINKILKAAQEYGLSIVDNNRSLPAPSKVQPAPPAQAQGRAAPQGRAVPQGLRPQKRKAEAPAVEPTPVQTNRIVEAQKDPEPIVTGNAPVENHESYKTNSPGRVTDKQRLTTSSRGQIILPKKIVDQEGNQTEIKIINSGGDKALQDRFKQLADDSKGVSGPPDLVRGGYLVRNCNTCGGTGTKNGKSCNVCGGEGITHQ